MKWSTKKPDYRTKWHVWFAWHPVHIDEDNKVWLEKVVRKQLGQQKYSFMDRFFCIPEYEYRESVLDLLKEEPVPINPARPPQPMTFRKPRSPITKIME